MVEQDNGAGAERQRIIDSLTPRDLASALLNKINEDPEGTQGLVSRLGDAHHNAFMRSIPGINPEKYPLMTTIDDTETTPADSPIESPTETTGTTSQDAAANTPTTSEPVDQPDSELERRVNAVLEGINSFPNSLYGNIYTGIDAALRIASSRKHHPEIQANFSPVNSPITSIEEMQEYLDRCGIKGLKAVFPHLGEDTMRTIDLLLKAINEDCDGPAGEIVLAIKSSYLNALNRRNGADASKYPSITNLAEYRAWQKAKATQAETPSVVPSAEPEISEKEPLVVQPPTQPTEPSQHTTVVDEPVITTPVETPAAPPPPTTSEPVPTEPVETVTPTAETTPAPEPPRNPEETPQYWAEILRSTKLYDLVAGLDPEWRLGDKKVKDVFSDIARTSDITLYDHNHYGRGHGTIDSYISCVMRSNQSEIDLLRANKHVFFAFASVKFPGQFEERDLSNWLKKYGLNIDSNAWVFQYKQPTPIKHSPAWERFYGKEVRYTDLAFVLNEDQGKKFNEFVHDNPLLIDQLFEELFPGLRSKDQLTTAPFEELNYIYALDDIEAQTKKPEVIPVSR